MAEKMIVGIGDLHGENPSFITLLQNLQTKYNLFEGGRLTNRVRLRPGIEIVQTGDYIDRGEHGRDVLTVSMKLARENPRKVTQLMGNHELLALSEIERAEAALVGNEDWEIFRAYDYGGIHWSNGGSSFIKEFGDYPREAMENYVKAMGENEEIGGWMRKLKPMKIGRIADKRILFVHAGMPAFVNGLQDLMRCKARIEKHLRTDVKDLGGHMIKYHDHDLVDDNHSIFWDRWMNGSLDTTKDERIKNAGLDYVVIGHTPTDGRIGRIGQRTFNIDLNLHRGYMPGAIVFKPDGVYGFYSPREEEKLVDY